MTGTIVTLAAIGFILNGANSVLSLRRHEPEHSWWAAIRAIACAGVIVGAI